MNQSDLAPAYVTAVITLYIEMPDTPMRVSASDQWLARHLCEDGVPLETVETALLLGSLRRLIRPADSPRRLIRPADSPRLAPIRSLAYFRPVIEELQENPAPQNYRDYLRLKLRMATQKPPADAQKNTFSDER